MRLLPITLAALVAAGGATAASAQSTTATSGPFPITGNVPALCSGGTLGGGGTSFDLGVLVDVGTGLLRTDLSAAPKTLTGGFCTARSTITVHATPLLSVNNTGTPPGGFSRTVHFSATAAGWSPAAAVFATGAASNPSAVQERSSAFQGDINVSIGSFSTGGGNALRLVADPAYQGTVTVTLAVAS